MSKESIEIYNGEERKSTKALVDLSKAKVCKSCKAICHWAKTIPYQKFVLVSLDEEKRWRNHRVICEGGYNALDAEFEKIAKEMIKCQWAGKLNDEVLISNLRNLKNYIFKNFVPKK